ncbi:PilT protein domain protein (fragment) [Mesorhizobium metallidurans STM 2683]|uniref:PilT protein domain protein n=1 Tax=Mesorhizobium metallidurans STM 2683 TaxID=1297569 RepID=M5EXT9_9HYPH
MQFPVLEFDREDARHAGDIRAALATLGTPIGPYGALIGGQARARNLTLVTRNVREFERIKNLAVETW